MNGNGTIIALRSGRMTLTAVPRCGGSLASWRLSTADGPVDLFRPASDRALAGAFAPDMACFPLVPFSNRIGGGRFVFQGREVKLETDPGSPHRIHGHGWSSPWTVGAVTDNAVRMEFDHPARDWPWSYRTVQTLALDDDGLTIALDLVNASDSDMPAGLGLHPYFAKSPGSRVFADVRAVWDNDETILPRQRRALPAAWDFRHGVVMDGLALDNGFTGWTGKAVLERPREGLCITMLADGPFGHLIVYAPLGEPYLCLEPVTHMTDALNRQQEPDAGVIALPPGERLRVTVRFLLSRL
ncbi:aldose 1-epimerase [Azospirillum picis]|uniref:Aldose 1-epimerase n=1 Tax=Azospirillum picis TaxID=488438 RepID=A0ABU0MGT2_9PROT|nr:aldose 1-epimerase [Azospirillum picis]MBP2298512.1 aldose 1-epimerase [Azospirillum picis]MDQ0532439.1 aldose 1-epimerase [Azospirillum picis]